MEDKILLQKSASKMMKSAVRVTTVNGGKETSVEIRNIIIPQLGWLTIEKLEN